jgi:chromosome segregation protein
MPALDERRRAQHDEVNLQSAKQTDLAARMAALRALQEKIQTEGKLKPWLAKHGLESLQGLWTQVHIEPGWETALESALRERLNALQVGRIDTLRAFAADPPPARLAFYTVPQAALPDTHRTLPRLADLLRLGDAGLHALFSDWLEGVYPARSLDDAIAHRGKLTHGEVIMTREGHTVSAHAVGFHAPDSEHDGLLARAQEIENLERQLRAQVLIAEARSALVRLEARHRCQPAPGHVTPRSDGDQGRCAPGWWSCCA